MFRNIWHKIKECIISLSRKPTSNDSLDEYYGTFKDGSVQFLVSENKVIDIKGTRIGVIKFFNSFYEMSQGLSRIFCDHKHLEDRIFGKGDSLLTKDSLPVALCLTETLIISSASERKELNSGRVAFRCDEKYGVDIFGTKEGLKNFSSILIEKIGKEIDSNYISVNDIEVNGVSILTDDSVRVCIKIIAE